MNDERQQRISEIANDVNPLHVRFDAVIWIAVLHYSSFPTFPVRAHFVLVCLFICFNFLFNQLVPFWFNDASVIARNGCWLLVFGLCFIFAAISVHLSPIIVLTNIGHEIAVAVFFCLLFLMFNRRNEIVDEKRDQRALAFKLVHLVITFSSRIIRFVLRQNVWIESWKMWGNGTNQIRFVSSAKTN